MYTIKRTDKTDSDFVNLVAELDAYLKVTDGEDHGFYNQFNGLENIHHAIVLYSGSKAIGCGAIKKFDADSAEVKRMYVQPDQRGTGAATQILTGLEDWARELGFKCCILETGSRQVEAVRFYYKSGYQKTANYGQYIGVENSNCFEKYLS
ncbi:GNAT family N-acetyltransferase [Pseudotenacibaculum sp. MALMAid0570]|uniref:GNAT family N-acetyltransferase n=1 Tax=Pseudotenacibaculum sp. MALMAid0570 TaxID=3143938 RepID=UPI0032E04F9D